MFLYICDGLVFCSDPQLESAPTYTILSDEVISHGSEVKIWYNSPSSVGMKCCVASRSSRAILPVSRGEKKDETC